MEIVRDKLINVAKEVVSVMYEYYPDGALKRLESAFTENAKLFVMLFDANRTNARSQFERVRRALYDNVHMIASMLAALNKHFVAKDLYKWLGQVVDHVAECALYRASSDFKNEINKFEVLESLMLEVADYITSGIFREHLPRLD